MRVSKTLVFLLFVLKLILMVLLVKLFRDILWHSDPGERVPNVVHFVRFGDDNLTFIEAVCILAALKNQKPNQLYIHTDRRDFDGGKYWDVVVQDPLASGVVRVEYRESLDFGSLAYEKVRILWEYGGIYVDNDAYIVRNLEEFFDIEMSLGFNGSAVFDQILIAKKGAGFLTLWMDYLSKRRNVGGPAQIVDEFPEMVNPVSHFLADASAAVTHMLYYSDTGLWKQHYAIHLNADHQEKLTSDVLMVAGGNSSAPRLITRKMYPVTFDDDNVLAYPTNLRQMVLDVYPYNASVMRHFRHIYPHLPRSESEDPDEEQYNTE